MMPLNEKVGCGYHGPHPTLLWYHPHLRRSENKAASSPGRGKMRRSSYEEAERTWHKILAMPEPKNPTPKEVFAQTGWTVTELRIEALRRKHLTPQKVG